jgi:hypothetical protein
MSRDENSWVETASPELRAYVDYTESTRDVEIHVYRLRGGGWLFSYSGCFENHDPYAGPGGVPFATAEEAMVVARDPSEHEPPLYGVYMGDDEPAE